MSAPNLINVSEIIGKSAYQLADTTYATFTGLLNAANSNELIKVHTFKVVNIDGSNDADISVKIMNNAANTLKGYLAFTITVPKDSTLVLVSRDTAIYLQEDERIEILASSVDDLHCTASYEVIS